MAATPQKVQIFNHYTITIQNPPLGQSKLIGVRRPPVGRASVKLIQKPQLQPTVQHPKEFTGEEMRLICKNYVDRDGLQTPSTAVVVPFDGLIGHWLPLPIEKRQTQCDFHPETTKHPLDHVCFPNLRDTTRSYLVVRP